MAKEIIWTLRSIQDRIQIYHYWLEHNKSRAYSSKLESLFNVTAKLISTFPEIGTATNFPEVRVKVVKSFKLFYRIREDKIEILRIWDSRQDSQNLKIK